MFGPMETDEIKNIITSALKELSLNVRESSPEPHMFYYTSKILELKFRGQVISSVTIGQVDRGP